MARKDQLRKQRAGTVINATSKQQEKDIIKALSDVVNYIDEKYGEKVILVHSKQWYIKDIVKELRITYPEVEFHYHFDRSSIRPDGGILYIKGQPDDEYIYPILIAEVKNQGTNDLRAREGLPRQARGNAIERLGKNLIGLRTALLRESIFPFVCFGYGCDFEPESSILDRVSTMAMFGKLNHIYLFSEGNGEFNRGSFYFRPNPWSIEEMAKIMKEISERSILYYLSKYGERHFQKPPSSTTRRLK